MKILKFYNSIISSDISNIRKVVDDIVEYLKGLYQINKECCIFDSKVILNELILNAIKHGNKEDRTKLVKVTAAIINNKYLLFQIEDEGIGYNYNCSLNNNGYLECADESLLPESGRGMLLVSCLCDRIKYNKKGNKIAVLKKMNAE